MAGGWLNQERPWRPPLLLPLRHELWRVWHKGTMDMQFLSITVKTVLIELKMTEEQTEDALS
jgi:hypothetical protein